MHAVVFGLQSYSTVQTSLTVGAVTTDCLQRRDGQLLAEARCVAVKRVPLTHAGKPANVATHEWVEWRVFYCWSLLQYLQRRSPSLRLGRRIM